MLKEMCWLATMGTNETKILHLRTTPHQPWRPYSAFPQYAVADYPVPHGSRGWATYQKLLKAGWTLIPSDRATATPIVASLTPRSH